MDACLVRDSIKLRAAILSKIKANKVTLTSLASKIGSHKSHLSRWSHGDSRAITAARTIALANCLGIEVDLTVKFNG